MFPKGTVTAAVTPAEKPPVVAQKQSTVVYMVDNTDLQVDAVNESYWRIQRARICACAVVLTTLILVAGTLGGIAIVLKHTNRVATTDPTPSLNHDHKPLFSNEVPLPKLPESTIRIKIDDGGLLPPTEPATPDLIGIDDVTDDIAVIELLPTVSLSSSDDEPQSSVQSSDPSYYYGRNYLSSSYPYDGWYANGQEGSPPWDRSDWIGPSERAREETDVNTSGDDQENDESDANGQVEDTPPWDQSDLTGPPEPSIDDTYVESDPPGPDDFSVRLIESTKPATPDTIANDDVTDDIAVIELLPTISLSSSDDEPVQSSSVPSYLLGRNYISSSDPERAREKTEEEEASGNDSENDEWDSNEQTEGIPPWDRSDLTGPPEPSIDEIVVEPDSPRPDDSSVRFPDSSSDAYHWRSRASDGIVAYSSLDDYSSSATA